TLFLLDSKSFSSCCTLAFLSAITVFKVDVDDSIRIFCCSDSSLVAANSFSRLSIRCMRSFGTSISD
ncbi:hypothetical protein PFISCL1PPCAC_20315, partial [Pristionchus fissidentatus]